MDLDDAGAGVVYTVSTGTGADTITATETAANTVVNTGDGNDTLVLDSTSTALGTFAMGDGTGDTVDLSSADTDYSGYGVWTGVEIMTLLGGGTVTLSEAQIDNDATFQVRGGNSTISVTGNTIDVSGVTFLAGNTSFFSLVGAGTADTLTGSDAGDDLDGNAGADTLTGGLGADSFIFATGDTGQTLATADTVTDFSSSQGDKIDLTVDISGLVDGTNYVEADGAATADFAAFLVNAAASAAFTGTTAGNVYVEYDVGGSGNAWLIVDEDGDGTVNAGDTVIILTGVDEAADIDIGDFE
jgi:hypothetical protein